MNVKDLLQITIWNRGMKVGYRKGRRQTIDDLRFYANQLAQMNEHERQTQPENKEHTAFEDGMVAGIRMAMIMIQDEIKIEAADA